jgi:hypothetical protein
MKDMELKIIKLEQGVTIFNYEELKAELEVSLQKYRGYVVNAAEIAIAKTDRAGLNKLLKAVADKRKETKNVILAQFSEVAEPQFKELEKMISDCIVGIDDGIKANEESEKAEKRENTLKLWQTLDFNLLPFEAVFVDQWLNKTYSMAKIKEDMLSTIEKVNNDLKLIEQFGKDVNMLKARYLASKDLNVTRIISEYNQETEIKEKIVSSQTNDVVTQSDNTISVKFEVTGSKEQIQSLIEYMKLSGLHAKSL